MKKFILFPILIALFGTESSGEQYYFRQYTNKEGLHQAFIYSISQDVDGYLWLGTAEGLYSFNGFEFEHITKEDGIAENFVTKVLRDRSGNMWAGHQNGSLSVKTKKGYVRLNEDPEFHGTVTDIIQDDQGNIWATVQNQGLLSINENLDIKLVHFSIEQEPLTQIESAGNNIFIIGTQENLYMARYNGADGSMAVIKRIDNYPGSKVVEIIASVPNKFIIISQEDGLFGLRADSLFDNYSFYTIDDNTDGSLGNLQGGIVDGTGMLWLNSLGNGLIQFQIDANQKYSRVARISTENGLVSGNVKSVFEDYEGNLWLGMFGEGLLRYVDNNLKFFNYSSDGESTGIYAITGDPEGLLVVAGNRLIRLNQVGDTELNSYPLPNIPSEDRVNTAYLADDGTVWLGFEQSGLYCSDPGEFRFRSVFISNDNLANSVNHLTGQGDYIWISTKKGVCRINRGTYETRWFTTNDGLPHNNIQQLYIDSKERVLIATLCSEIYYIFDEEVVAVLKNSEMDPFNSLISIREGKDGILWVGTHGNGIWKIDADINQNYSRVSGLLSDFCYSLTVNEKGEPIVGHTGGLSHIDPLENRIKTFSRFEGVRSSSEFFPNAIYTDHFGNTWFGTSEGLVKYTSGLSKGGMIPPMLQICAVLLNGDTIDHTKGPIILKPGQYELEVDFIGISFTNPEMVFYQTQLEGYNNDWSTPTFSRKMVLDRIGHGNYSFRIRAFNENDITSEISAAFELKIKKPVYLLIWFYVIIALISGFAFYVILRIRERNHRMVQVRLLKNLDEKTKEIIVKEEIIKERKKVEKVLIEAKTKAELSEKLKTSFLQNMSHEIRTPMNAIVGFSMLLKEEGLSNENRNEFIKNISRNAESLLMLINDIIDLSKLETNQLEIKKGVYIVNEMIHDLESIYRKKLKVEGKEEIEFAAVCPADYELKMLTDITRLKQALNNLLDNAVKFTESGRITFGYSLNEKHITFFVEDTGIGLSDDKRDVIFDLFRKIENDRFKLYGGTGLGLTLARYLVNLMGGEINVESKLNIGSKFYFVLPFLSGNESPDGLIL
ncbi:MAG: hypothetical protein KAR19_10000 [Bacteroidales bacterium]|nr:hypothetical protein [Bacteroidales bacterium]